MVAQPIPARMKMGTIINSGDDDVIKLPERNAVPSIITPARIVFLLPSFEAIIPTGIYDTIAAA